MASPAVALRSQCGRRTGANRMRSNRRAVARRVFCATPSNADILPAKALRCPGGGIRGRHPDSPAPASPCGIARHAFRLPQPTGCAPASHAGRTHPGIRRSTCRGRCRKTSAPRPASRRQARRLPNPCRKGSPQDGSRRPTPTTPEASELLQAQACGRSSSSSGVARTPRTNEYRNSSRHLSLDGTPGCGHTVLNVLMMNAHVFIPLGPVFPHRAFFVFGTFKFSFNPVPALRAGRPVQPAPAVLRAGPQVRIPCGCLPEPFRRREPGGLGRRNAMTATDDHGSTIFLNRLMK